MIVVDDAAQPTQPRLNPGPLAWARAEWRRRWGALTLLALLVAAAGGATVAAAAAAGRTATAFDRMLHEMRAENIEVFGFTDDGLVDLDLSRLGDVMAIDGVQGLFAGAFTAVAIPELPVFLATTIVDARGDVLRPVTVEGRHIDVDGLDTLAADEVLLNEAYADLLGVGVGDTVTLVSMDQEQFLPFMGSDPAVGAPAGPTIVARVAAVSRYVEDVTDRPGPNLTLPPAFLAEFGDDVGHCICYVAVRADPEAIDAVMAELATVYPEAEVRPAQDFSGRTAAATDLQVRAWWLIALVAAVAGVVACVQACTRLMRALLPDDATLAALGMTRRERRGGRALVAVPACVLGGAGAIPVAYALSPWSPVGITRRAEPHPGLHWGGWTIPAGTALVLVAVLVLAAVTASIVRDRPDPAGVTLGGARGPTSSLGVRLALGPGRAAVAGLFMAVTGLVGGLTLERSIDHVLTTPALYGADYDAIVRAEDGSDVRLRADELAADPEIEAVGLLWAVPIGWSTGGLEVAGPDRADRPDRGQAWVYPTALTSRKGVVSLRLSEGRNPAAADEVSVGRETLDVLGAGLGDQVTVTGADGTRRLTIVGSHAEAEFDEVSHRGFALTPDGLSALVDAVPTGPVVRLGDGVDRDAALARHAGVHLELMQPPSKVSHLGELGGLPIRVGQLLALLGAIALVNAAVLTVRQARRQLAILRSLGFTGAQVVGAHVWQGVLTAALAVPAGVLAGFVTGRAIARQLVENVGAFAGTVLPTATWVVVGLAVAACLAAAVMTGALALGQRPGAVLRAE